MSSLEECGGSVSFQTILIRLFRETQLTSILTMRMEVEKSCSASLRKLLEESSFIGHVNKDLFVMQSGTTMYLCNGSSLRYSGLMCLRSKTNGE